MKTVFEDRVGRRRLAIVRLVWLLGFAVTLLVTGFGISLAIVPLLSSGTRETRHPQIAESAVLNLRHAAARAALLRTSRTRRVAGVRVHDRLAVAFYAPWEEAGLQSFRAHAQNLDVIVPAWLALTSSGNAIDDSNFNLEENPR